MVSGKSTKAVRSARSAVVTPRSTPWGLIAGVMVVVLFAGAVFGYAYLQSKQKTDRIDALAPFTPTAQNQDPARDIPGVVVETYQGGQAQHVSADKQIAYTHSPPFGGAHDQSWATCSGVVYPQAVRTENMVHTLEHGAVWIAYDPAQANPDTIATLSRKVENQPFMVMSPYPGMDAPISVQGWGHQLKLADANDPRVDQFIFAMRRNPYIAPEPRGSCNELGPGSFVQSAPPPFVPSPPVSEVGNGTVVAEVGPATPAAPGVPGAPGAPGAPNGPTG